MLDTETGTTWQYVFGDYCREKAAPYDVRQVEVTESCKDAEDSFHNVPSFERVSVEGLYKTPIQAMLDDSFQRQAMRPVKKAMQNLEPN